MNLIMANNSITLHATDEQLVAIRSLYNEKGWTFEFEDKKGGIQRELGEMNSAEPDRAEQCDWKAVNVPHPEEGDVECPHCLSTPCITAERNRQAWWERIQHPARQKNSEARKRHYKRFWTMLDERKVFQKQVYQDRKKQALGRDPRYTKYTYHKRELMPNCVISMVRRWLPNPSSMAYMGHKWE